MRILHTSAFYYTRAGGAEEVVRQISERLAVRGHDVTVATTSLPERKSTMLHGVQIVEFPIHAVLGHSVLGIRGDTTSFRDFLHIGNWDIVMNYAAQTWPTDITFRQLSRLRSKTVLAACGYSGLIGARRLLYEGYFRRLPHFLRQYGAIVYHSNSYQDKAFGDRYGIRNYRVIPNAVDSAEFLTPRIDFRRQYNITTEHLIVTIGNHFSNKGHDRVLAAFKNLNDATLVIVGHNSAPWYRSCYSACKRAARRESRILLLENAPRTHTVAALLAADLFLCGSHIEAFPLVILEAMASRTPWIAFPAGNIAELPGGIVVDSVEQMTAKARRLFSDTPARLVLADEGRCAQRAEFHWEKIVDQYEDLYESLLAGEPVAACASAAERHA